MTGFTIYETLRIFTPGALAVAILNVSLRLSTGPEVLTPAGGGPQALVDAVETVATFVLLALLLGLLLYLIDFPERLRIFKGDPGWGAVQPSEAMRALISKTEDSTEQRYRDHFLSLYFIFSDKYLPIDLHKRIYLFGAVYKIFVDLRILFIAAFLIAVPASIVAARAQATVGLLVSPSGSIAVAGVLAYVIVMGEFAARTRRVRHLENPSSTPTQAPHLGVGGVVVLFGLAALSILIAAVAPGGIAWGSILAALATVVLWFWFEVGPPKPKPRQGEIVRWRDKALLKLGCEISDQPQFTARQRTWLDLAVIAPGLAGASIAGAYLGRSPADVLAWGILVAPATAIMAIRKHEERLLGAYRHQVAWIELHGAKIREILEGKAGFGDLEKTPTQSPNEDETSLPTDLR